MKLAGLKFHIYVIPHICINIPTEYFEKYLRKEEIFMAQGFSKTHIDKVLYDAYGLRLVDEHQGYKAYRYRRFHTYKVIDRTGAVIAEHITLKPLADFLKAAGDY